MLKRFICTGIAMLAASVASASVTVSVDLLAGADAGAAAQPAGTLSIDVFADVTTDDAWSAGGLRAITQNGSSLRYAHAGVPAGDPNAVTAPGAGNQYSTFISRPKVRDAANRFTDTVAQVAGGYNPTSGVITNTASEVNVAWFTTSFVTGGDGYVGRVSVNLPAGAPAVSDANYGVGAVGSHPAGSTVVLASFCETGNPIPPGTVATTRLVPQITGLSWEVWYIPEPASLALLALGGLAAFRRR